MLNCSCVFVEMFLTLTFAWKLQGFPLSKFKIFRVRMMQRNMWCPQSIPQKMPPKTLPASFFVKLIAKARKEKAFSFQVLLLFVSENGYMSQKIDDNIYPYTIHMYITQTMYNLYMYIYYIPIHMYVCSQPLHYSKLPTFAAAVCGRPQGFYLMSGTNLGEGKGRSTIDGLGCGCGYMMVIGR